MPTGVPGATNTSTATKSLSLLTDILSKSKTSFKAPGNVGNTHDIAQSLLKMRNTISGKQVDNSVVRQACSKDNSSQKPASIHAITAE